MVGSSHHNAIKNAFKFVTRHKALGERPIALLFTSRDLVAIALQDSFMLFSCGIAQMFMRAPRKCQRAGSIITSCLESAQQLEKVSCNDVA